MNSNSNHHLRTLLQWSCLSILMFFGALLVQAQTTGKVEDILIAESRHADQPVEVNDLRIDGAKVLLGKTFTSANKDWVRAMSFDVKNISSKPITYLQMRLLFVPAGEKAAPCVFPLIRGIDTFAKPKSASREVGSEPSAILLRQGKSVRVSFNDETYDGFLRFLKDIKWQGNLFAIKVYVSRVMFKDGTIWAKGSEVVPDPEDPRRLIPIAKYLASNNYEYRNVRHSYFAKPRAENYSILKKVTLPAVESECTRAAEIYLENCSGDCTRETYTPYMNGENKWQWVYVPCFDWQGQYCQWYAFVREMTYEPCNS